jgi:hypothetical protein
VTTEPGSSPPMPSRSESAPAAAGESTSDLLRSMLSQAVEDQLLDQREIVGAIGDVRAEVMRLSQELADMRAQQPRDDAEAQINTVTVEMREAVQFLSERLDGVTGMVAQRGEELAEIRTALTAIDAHLRAQGETIGVLSAGVQSLPSYGERVSALQDNLQVLHRQLAGIEAALAATEDNPVDERLRSIETLVAPLAARLDAVSDTSVAQSGSMSELQSALGQLQSALAAMQGRIEPLASDITAIGADVAGLVEGTADGAALDSRVSESVNHAVRQTERRMIEHIDEAVLALAQTLLRRRPVSIASQMTATPTTEAPAALNTGPGAAEPATDTDPGAAEPATLTDDVDSDDDVESADDAAADHGVPVGDLAEPDDEPTSLPEQADDAELSAAEARAHDAPTVDEPIAAEPPTLAWSPETPPERDPTDPTVVPDTVVPDEDHTRKRRWFSSPDR